MRAVSGMFLLLSSPSQKSAPTASGHAVASSPGRPRAAHCVLVCVSPARQSPRTDAGSWADVHATQNATRDGNKGTGSAWTGQMDGGEEAGEVSHGPLTRVLARACTAPRFEN